MIFSEKTGKRLSDKNHTNSLLLYENAFWTLGEYLIAGIDEAGRGPLAGPLVAACVIMPAQPVFYKINDSKKMTPKNRKELFYKIKEYALDYCICVINSDRIDEINILNAAKEAFLNAVLGMKIKPHYVLTDAMPLNKTLCCIELISGDSRSYNIAAASILAKYTRDRIMMEYHLQYPEYKFKNNKGYGTKEHISKLLEIGICPIHRRSFLGKIFSK